MSDHLSDWAPNGILERIVDQVNQCEGVFDYHNVRVWPSGPFQMADLHVRMGNKPDVKTSHIRTEQIQQINRKILKDTDVTVHVKH